VWLLEMEEKHLRKVRGVVPVLVVIAAFTIQMCAQKSSAPSTAAPLVLTGAIPLPNVKGRIDHLEFDPAHNRLFVSALGNNSEEIIGHRCTDSASYDFWSADSAGRGVFAGDQQAVRRKR